jgi:hypothetical protein
MMYKIALVLAYFGRLPDYFDLWLTSAACNPTIDWLLFTDDETPFAYPPNARVSYLSFEQMRRRARAVFPFDISLETPYKLCDFKPAYGEIFAVELAGYDFWGHCDPDMLWGNLRKFLPDGVLKGYDRIYDTGFFSLYPNEARRNALYRALSAEGCHDWRKVFASDKPFAFDEWSGGRGFNAILEKNGFTIYNRPIAFADVLWSGYTLQASRAVYGPPEGRALERRKKHVAYVSDCGTLTQYALLDGKKFVATEEMFAHFQKRPLVKAWGADAKTPDAFAAAPPNRIFPLTEPVTADWLKEHCKEKRFYFQYYRVRFNNLKRKAKAFWSA